MAQISYEVGDKYNSMLREYIGGQLHLMLIGGETDKHLRFPKFTTGMPTNFTTKSVIRPGYKALMERAGYSDDFMRDPRKMSQMINPFSLHFLEGDMLEFDFLPDPLTHSSYVSFTIWQEVMPGVLAHTYGADDKRYATIHLSYAKHEQERVMLFLLHMDKYFEDHTNSDKLLRIISNDGPFWEEDGVLKYTSLDNIFLRKDDISRICGDIEQFLKPQTRKTYDYFGVTYKRTYLLSGIPGSGKSSLIRALASKYGYNLCVLNYTETKDSYVQTLLKRLPERSFFVLEDFDSIIEERKKHDESTNKISFSGILKMLDGEYSPAGAIIFITTNYKDRFDQAMFRPGRIDFVMEFDVACAEQISQMFIHYMSLNPETTSVYTDCAILANVREKAVIFCKKVSKLGVPITGALIQQYLFRYFGNIDGAVSNTEEINKMYNSLPNDSSPKGLYS